MQINEELKKLIPPLTQDEYDTLEKSIVAEGCRDPLILWDNTIVDGHNRYEICKNHGIAYKTSPMSFDSIESVKIWMIDNQRGRRNLTDGWKYELAQVKKAILAEKGREKQSTENNKWRDESLLSNNDKSEKHNTQKEIAADLGWSTGKTAQADYVWRHGDDDIKEKIKIGDVSINQAYNTVKSKSPIVSLFTGNNEWYTPSEYIESARVVMGSIDTDPASNEYANKTVKANLYFTEEDDGLSKKWEGNVWMNPPYSQPLVGDFCSSLIDRYLSNEINQAVVLVNNSADTKWFHILANSSSAFCLTKGRISFYNSSGKSAPTNGQAFFYFGDNTSLFTSEFSKHGMIVKLIRSYGGDYDT